MSADWTTELQARLPHDRVVNAGVGGDLARNLLARLDEVVACDPDVVIVLIGTNDVVAGMDQTWLADLRRGRSIPVEPHLDGYRTCLTEIVHRLHTETRAHVALVELPMLGEHLGSAANLRVGEHNAVIHRVAAATGTPVLPLHERLVAALPAGHRPAPFDGSRRTAVRATVARRLLRRSWDGVARINGLLMLTDHVHLSDRAGHILAGLVADFVLDERRREDPGPGPTVAG